MQPKYNPTNGPGTPCKVASGFRERACRLQRARDPSDDKRATLIEDAYCKVSSCVVPAHSSTCPTIRLHCPSFCAPSQNYAAYLPKCMHQLNSQQHTKNSIHLTTTPSSQSIVEPPLDSPSGSGAASSQGRARTISNTLSRTSPFGACSSA